MAKFRVAASLLTDGQSLVKGKNFESWRTVGSVVSASRLFEAREIDEIVLLDVKAREQRRSINPELVSSVNENISLPISVGGGIDTIDKISELIGAGADKVVLGTAAVANPKLVSDGAAKFGSQAIAVSIDYRESSRMALFTNSGLIKHDLNIPELALKMQELGCGEIIFQSIEREGSYKGLDLSVSDLASDLNIPSILSCGFGSINHALDAANANFAGISIGSAFQFQPITPLEIKRALKVNGIPVRT